MDELLDIGSRQSSASAEGGVARVYVARENVSGEDGVFISYDPDRGRIVVNEREHRAARVDSLRMDLGPLVEYRDVDGDGVFTPQVDEFVRSWSMRQLEWTLAPIEVSRSGHVVFARGALPGEGGGVMGVELRSSGSYADPNGVEVNLSSLNLRFVLDPPERAQNGTAFALLVADEQRGAVAGIEPTGSFPWDRVVQGGQGEAFATSVLREDRRPGDAVRAERTLLTLVEGAPGHGAGAVGAGDAAAREDGGSAVTSPGAMARCGLRFQCG